MFSIRRIRHIHRIRIFYISFYICMKTVNTYKFYVNTHTYIVIHWNDSYCSCSSVHKHIQHSRRIYVLCMIMMLTFCNIYRCAIYDFIYRLFYCYEYLNFMNYCLQCFKWEDMLLINIKDGHKNVICWTLYLLFLLYIYL